jgi:hypothetical protein
VARSARTNVDDAVPLKPEDLHVVLPVPHTPTACAGAAAGFVLRRIAYRAGAYAPGIQEGLFYDLATPGAGGSLDRVAGWLTERSGELHAMGYRLGGRRILGERTDALLAWIREGQGYRGAILATEYGRLHPSEGDASLDHAVGVTLDRLEPKAAEDLLMIDPWPGTKNGARDRGALSPRLESAHRFHKYAALILFWSGWS